MQLCRPDPGFTGSRTVESGMARVSGLPSTTVVLVHGLWLSGWALALLRARIARRGYRAVTFSYASVADDLDVNARRLAAFSRLQPGRILHFAGHSLGGLLILRMLALEPERRCGRVLLIGSPVRDSIAMRGLSRLSAGRALMGEALDQWYSVPRPDLGLRYEIGVIAGSLGFGLGTLVAKLPAPHDGTVTVAETRCDSATDHIVLPVSHTGMLASARVADEACRFFDTGRFTHGGRARVR